MFEKQYNNFKPLFWLMKGVLNLSVLQTDMSLKKKLYSILEKLQAIQYAE